MNNVVLFCILAGIIILIVLLIVLLIRTRITSVSSKVDSEKLNQIYGANEEIKGKLNTLEALTNSQYVNLQNVSKSQSESVNRVLYENNDSLNEALGKMINSNAKSMENLYKSLGEIRGLSQGINDLHRVLSNVKDRGTWAEIQLQGILDQTLPPNMYVKNYNAKSKSAEHVEFAVKIPVSKDGDQFAYLPVDSKFPMEDYRRLCEASDRADKEAIDRARKDLAVALKTQARNIKKYIHLPETTPYAIMYLATEGLYSEVASNHYFMLEEIQNKYKILVSGPSTILAFINTLVLSYRATVINKKTKEIQDLLSATKMQYEKFADLLTTAGNHIERASKSIIEAQKRNDIIKKRLESVDKLELAEAEEI
ncbi:MAG: DNA recombination protein RmuC [Eggerthellaceae bacterium]|nr:DNA recombination protein RmuC [Eggerthellaceae bacterium]